MKTLIKDIQLVDFKNVSATSMCILINEQGIIEELSPVLPSNEIDYQIIEGENRYALPGLINLHAHLLGSGAPLNVPENTILKKLVTHLLTTRFGKNRLRSVMQRNAEVELQSGVTTIRTLGEACYQDIVLRNQISKGEVIGPNLVVSGPMLSAKGGHGTPFVATENQSTDDYIQNYQKNRNYGVDWIKVCVTGGVTDANALGEAGEVQVPLEQLKVLCQESHKQGILVAAHAESLEGVKIALKAGVDSIEHGFTMNQEIIDLFKHNPKAYRGYSVLIPTFSPAIVFDKLSRDDLGITDLIYQNGKLVYQGMLNGYQQALENGITVGVGNDSSMTFVPHYDYWRELFYHQKLGKLTNQEVLAMATIGNARILGLEKRIGSITLGKEADIILLKENPLENLQALQSIDLVLKKGKVIPQNPFRHKKRIDTLLKEVLNQLNE